MKKTASLIVFVLSFVLLGTCMFPGYPVSRLEKQKNRLVGKEFQSFFHVIDEPAVKHQEHFLVFLFTGFDCQPCVEKGFKFAKQAVDFYPNVYLVGSNANISMVQLQYDCDRFVFSDMKEKIRKDLKYILTPAFLLVNKKGKILSIHYIIRGSWEKEKTALVNKLKSLQ